MADMRRIGDTEKCPACGWRVDAGAYRCPKCRVYFCYKCRARVGERDTQYQCADQSCRCYGKLLCNACVVSVSEDRTSEVPNTDATQAALIAGGVAALYAWFAPLTEYLGRSVGVPPSLVAFLVGLCCAVTAGNALRGLGFNVWGSTDRKHEVTSTSRHTCCVVCRHPSKELR